MKTVLFVIAIFISVWSSFINFGSLFAKQRIPASNIVIMAAGYTAIITKILDIW